MKYTLVHPNNAPAPISLYLQDTTAVAAAVPNIGDSTLAKDIRDDKTYRVGKLEDGNIWLLDNLDLDLAASGASAVITAANTNASATALDALFNGVSGGGAGGNLAQDAVSDVGSYWSDSSVYPYIMTTYSGETVSDVTSVSVGGDWAMGIYYNLCAASAGSYCYDSDPSDVNVTEDICPSGWRMPTGGYDGEYSDLYDEYQSEDNQSLAFISALRLPFSGRGDSNGESYSRPGSYGYFFSSTYAYSGVSGVMLSNSGGYLGVDTSYGRSSSFGNSVRCVMDAN